METLNDKEKVQYLTALIEREFDGKQPDLLKMLPMAKFAYISQQHSIDAQVIGFEQKTKEPITPIYVCRQGGTVQEKEKGQEKGEEEVQYVSCLNFLEFWNLYDKKVGDKEKVEKKFDLISEDERRLILYHLPKYKLSKPDKQYRKDPATYLNNKSWNDEIIMPKSIEQPQTKTENLKTVYHNVLEQLNQQTHE